MPESTSSKIRTSTRSWACSADFKASVTLDSSPPEAIFRSGRRQRLAAALPERELLPELLPPRDQLRHAAPVLSREPRQPFAPRLDGLQGRGIGLEPRQVFRERTRRFAGRDARLLDRRQR